MIYEKYNGINYMLFTFHNIKISKAGLNIKSFQPRFNNVIQSRFLEAELLESAEGRDLLLLSARVCVRLRSVPVRVAGPEEARALDERERAPAHHQPAGPRLLLQHLGQAGGEAVGADVSQHGKND